MLLLNINYVPDKKIEALGLVKGNVVQSSHLGKDIILSLTENLPAVSGSRKKVLIIMRNQMGCWPLDG